MGFRVNHSDPPPQKSPTQQHLKGASRLVNPPDDAPEIVSAEAEEDQGERDYLGRFLRVADEALRHVKQGVLHRHKRGRIH
jgi:hypothetical protein